VIVVRRALLGRSIVTLAVALGVACSSKGNDAAVDAGDDCRVPSTRLPLANAASALTASLTKAGYTVQPGTMRFFRVEDCRTLDDCFGNNPTSPYGFYCLPPAPGASPVDSPLQTICPEGTRPTWSLREDEAVVLLGRTPPRARYFGYRSYVYSRTLPDGVRKALFASLGDTLNPLTIATSGTPCAKGALAGVAAFDADVAIVTTADARLDTILRRELTATGVPESIVNTDVVPRSIVHMGASPTDDDEAMLFRVALFDDEAAGDAWLDAPPVSILRVTPNAKATIEPYPVPTLRPRGTGTDEEALQPALSALVEAIHAARAPKKPIDTRMISIAPVGFHCLEENLNCLGDNQDTLYVASAPNTIDAPGDVGCSYVVAGVNHELTGKATYMNVSLYMTKKIMGVLSVTGAELQGSADTYLPTHPDRAKLYAWEFARDCAGRPRCSSIPTGDLGVPIGERLQFIMRPYLEPSTRTAPDAGEIAMPYVLKTCD
jgi:hypothetical protein